MWFLLFLASWCTRVVAVANPLGPNRFLGTCLDEAWVKQMETALGVSSQDRDSSGRLLNPFLQPALQFPRYRIEDPRTASEMAYADTCMPAGQKFFGTGQPTDGSTQGTVDGTLILDIGNWDTHWLSSMVLAIVAQEVSGYKVSINVGGKSVDVTQRMSSVGTGICTPTHLNVEVWSSTTMSSLRVYFNESYKVGGVGYYGLSGLYTPHEFVRVGTNATPQYFPHFYEHYATSDALISALSVVPFKSNPAYNPNANFCPDGYMGCKDNCEKSEACTLREATGKDCLVVAMLIPGYDQGYFQAVLSNLNIPAYFCFLGYSGLNTYASNAASSHTPLLFYHYEPDLFHVVHKGLFNRVFLPRTDPDRVKLSTGTYGEYGYGKKSDNPVDVDYPSLPLTKFAASIVKNLPIGSIFSKFTLTDSDINNLLSEYSVVSSDVTEPEPYFRAACNWMKENYDVWSEWLDRLPLCTLEEFVTSNVTGCENGSVVREIEFAWKSPNLANTSLPNNCDGGLAALPTTIYTSRSCDWIFENRRVWSGWMDEKPDCDSTFYDYNVSDCDSDAYRTVTYYWKLPNASDATLSAECENGVDLPKTVKTHCEYMPTSSPTFAAFAVLSTIVAGLLLVAIVLVFKNRNAPIIRRSQYELLLLMIFGGFFTTSAVIAYAGRPTQALCGIRPVLLTLGLTTIFGSLIIKSLRVYRVFMKAAMKRVKVTLLQMLKIISIFYIGDIVIFVAWFAADFPEPTITIKEATEFRGTVDRISCSSSSFIFTALLIFWKAILLMLGLYLSFLIRNVSVDFQESPWIFGSVVVVLVGCLVMMPMSYLVEMPAATYYVFLAVMLLLCTVLIMALMLGPKVFRLKEIASTTSGATTGSSKSRGSMVTTKSNASNMSESDADDMSKPSQKYQVKPTQNGAVNNTPPTVQE